MKTPRIDRVPWLGVEEDDEALEFGEEYVIEIQAMNEAGVSSAPRRERFVLERIGDGMYDTPRRVFVAVVSLLALAFVPGAGAGS